MSGNSTSVGGRLDADSFTAVGSAGDGYIELPSQSAMSAASAGNVKIFTDNSGDFSLIDDQVNAIAFNLAGLTASHRYTFPNANCELTGDSAPQTLTNKTILSSGGNTVDATSISGFTVSGTPTSGQYLTFNGANWSPQTISASSPASFTGNNISINVGNVGGVASFTDPRFTTPQIINVRTGTVGYGEFNSVAAAVASVTDASTTKRYVIYVGAGIFYEPPMVMKPFVYIRGFNKLATIIRPTTPATTLVTATNNNSIEECMFLGIGDGIGIDVDSCSTSYFGNLTMMNFGTLMRFAASTAITDTLLHEFLYYGPCQNGILVDGTTATSNFQVNVSISMGRMRCDATVANGLRFIGPYAKVSANSIRSVQASVGMGMYIADGANVELGNSKITDCLNGLIVANVGAGPTMYIRDTLWINNVSDIAIDHPGSQGIIGGIANRTKVNVDPAAAIVLAYTDIYGPASIITGEFIYSPANDTVLTETGSLLVYGAPIGTYEGGAVTAAVGLNVGVDPGLGYIQANASKVYVRKIEWLASVVLMTDNATNFVYVNETGVHVSGGVPDMFLNVMLARVVASNGAIEFIDTQTQSNMHPATKDFIMDRETETPTFASGCITSTGVGNTLDVTNGSYYYLHNKFTPTGGTGITMKSYYRDGVGGWTITPTTTLAALYDDGTGTLAAVPPGNWARYVLYIVGEAETYLLLYGQALFPTELQAGADPITVAPTQFVDGVAGIATITVDSTGALNVRDVRKTGSDGNAGVTSIVTDHGSLSGLSHDDHHQYLLVNGTRAMSGALNMGTNAITNASTYNGVTVELHGARHLPNGADPLTTAAPLASLSSLSTNAAGTANSFARSDHSHAIDVSGFSINSLTGTLTVSRGGTGQTALTSGRVLVGAGTSPVDLTKAAPTGAFVGTTDVQVLSNKDLQGSSTRFLNAAADGAVTLLPGVGAFNAQLDFPLSTNYTLSFPALTDTVATSTNSATFSNKTIRGGLNGNNVYANFINNPSNPVILPNSPPTATGQVLVIAGVPNAVWGNINSIAGNLSVPNGGTNRTTLTSNAVLIGNGINPVDTTKQAPIGDFVGTTDVQTLTNKTLAAATTTITGTVGNTLTFSPTGASSIVTTGASTLTMPSGTRTLVALDTTDTLTNKTITDPTNNVAASSLRYASGTVSTVGASVPTAGQVLTAINATTAAWQAPTAGTTFPDNTFAIYDNTDPTKQINFDAAGTSGTTTTIVSTQTTNVSVSLPDATDTLVGRDTTDTLTNKTLTAPVIATIVNTGTLTLPTTTTTLVGRNTVDTLTNKTLAAASTLISGTGGVAFTAGGTATTTFASSPSAPNTLTLPTSTDTLVGRSTTDTLSNKTMTMGSFSIVDGSTRSYLFTATGTASTSVTLTSAATASRVLTLPDISDTIVTKTTTDTLTNKSITGGAGGNTVSANLVRAVLVSTVAPTVGQVLTATTTTDAAWSTPSVTTVTGVLPVANGGTGNSTLTSNGVLVGNGTGAVSTAKAAPTGAFVGTTDTQTLSGKTLTAPVIATIVNGGTLTLPSGTDTLVGRNTTDILTNKTLSYTTSSIDVNLITGVNITGTPVQGNGIYMTGTPNVAQWGSLDLSNAASTIGTLSVAKGGTGATSLLAGNLLTGNGTGAIQATTSIPAGGLVGVSAIQTLSNKKLNSGSVSFEGATIGVDLLNFIPSGLDTLVFTGPTTATMPAGTVSIVAANSTDVLTNKTITSPTNTVAAQQLFTATGTVSVSASAAPTAGQLLVATSSSTATWQTYAGATAFADNTFNVYNFTDPTNKIVFSALGSTGTQTDIHTNQTANITIDLPGISTTLVGRNTTDTLTNKTLLNPIMSSIVNGGNTLTLPTQTDTLVARSTIDTLTNKTLTSTTNTIAAQQLFTATGTVSVSASAAPTAGQTLVASSGTVAAWATPSVTTVSGTLPVANGGTGATTLTAGNVLVGNGTSVVQTTKVAPTGVFVGTTDTQTLTNKTLNSTTNTIAAQLLFNATGTVSVSASAAPSAGQTLVASSGTVAAWATPSVTTVTGTLPVANGGTGNTTLTSGNVLVGAGTSAVTTTKAAPSGDFVGTTDTQTLTNKTLDGSVAGNDVAANRLLAVVLSGTAPLAGQVLTATSGTAAQWSSPSSASSAVYSSSFLTTATTNAATNVSGNNTNSVISFPGSAVQNITQFIVTASKNNNAANYTVRVQDNTNGLTIASVTVNATGTTIYSTTTIANVPAAAANLRIEALKIGGGTTTLTMQGWTVIC